MNDATPLAEALKRAEISQADFARALDVSPAQVNRWVKHRDVKRPSRVYRKAMLRELRKRGVEMEQEELWP